MNVVLKCHCVDLFCQVYTSMSDTIKDQNKDRMSRYCLVVSIASVT